jgi:putative ABC transport system permease protein
VPTRSTLSIAVRALRRNRLQTSLTIVGMTIGVAAVLAMIAIGTGAEAAIEDQIRAAGMNLIVVTAGNYKVKSTDDFGGGAVEPSAALRPNDDGAPTAWITLNAESAEPAEKKPQEIARRALRALRSSVVASVISFVSPTLHAHPEDDPMEKHDHPTARQRLGDSEAGLGSAATLTAADADAIRAIRGVQYVAEGLHQNVHVKAGDKRWFTRLHGTDERLPQIRRAWTMRSGRFFSAGEQSRAEQVMVLGSVAAQRVFGDAPAVGREVTIWNQSFRVVGVVTTTSWMVAPAPGDMTCDLPAAPGTGAYPNVPSIDPPLEQDQIPRGRPWLPEAQGGDQRLRGFLVRHSGSTADAGPVYGAGTIVGQRAAPSLL